MQKCGRNRRSIIAVFNIYTVWETPKKMTGTGNKTPKIYLPSIRKLLKLTGTIVIMRKMLLKNKKGHIYCEG